MLATLLIDDDRAFAAVARAALEREGLQADLAHSLQQARQAVAARGYDLVVLDRRLPDGDGLDWLPELRAAQPQAAVVMVTAHGDVASAVEAMRLGAADYLVKPIELSELVLKARKTADGLRLKARLQHVEERLSKRHALIAPRSPSMTSLLETMQRIAEQSPRSPVLLLGETGSGKEALAWHLHRSSFGEAAPFIQVNCAALPETMAESELFGHEKGAFTDARAQRQGLVELAQGGTLFLDEVGELSAALQAKLLTFLDGGRFRRLGGTSESTSTARVVAATNRDLEAQVRQGEFREDLWFRLSVFSLRVPPLRERREDIATLATGLLARIATEQGRRAVPTLTPGALERLAAYPFPGNVRELANILERSTVFEGTPALTLAWLSTPNATPGSDAHAFSISEVLPLREVERRYASWALGRLDGRRMETAKALGISHPTFVKLLRDD